MSAIRNFPRLTIPPGSELWRIHRVGLDPWYFRNDGLFRFDLVGNPVHGTCYLAADPLGAFAETLQNFRAIPIPRAELAERRLFRANISHALSLADLTHNDASAFEIDASISAGSPEDYKSSQELAAALYRVGFAGIRYRVRNDLEQDLIGVALFGPVGAQKAVAPMPAGVSTPIPEKVVSDACDRLNFRVRGPLLESI